MMTIITPPTAEPVSLAEAKLAARIDGTAHDTLVPTLITAAREAAEQIAGRALVTQTRRHELRDWPVCPVPELAATAVAVSYYSGGSWVALAAVQFGGAPGGTTIAAPTGAWPVLDETQAGPRVRVDITAGQAAADAPGCLRLYIMASVAHWIEHPGAMAAGGKAAANPLFAGLLDGLKVY